MLISCWAAKTIKDIKDIKDICDITSLLFNLKYVPTTIKSILYITQRQIILIADTKII